MSNFDKEKIVLPPPPTKAKSKLKRVHTISGSSVCNNGNDRNDHVDDATEKSYESESTKNTKAFATPNVPFQIDYSSFNPISTTCNSKRGEEFLSPESQQNFKIGFSEFSAFKPPSLMNDDCSIELWSISDEQRMYYLKQFSMLQRKSPNGSIRGVVAKIFFEKSGLKTKDLSHIWKLSDIDGDGALSLPEFCIAMHLVILRRNQVKLPDQLPLPLKKAYLSLCQIEKPQLSDIDEKDGRSLSQNWTKFNDSPYSSNTSLSSSPAKLANFDYDILEYVNNNPNIRHPIPVRISPATSATTTTTSPASLSMDQYPLFDNGRKSSSNSVGSTPNSNSFEVNYSPFFSVPKQERPHSETFSFNKSDGPINFGLNNLSEKQIHDYMEDLEHRLQHLYARTTDFVDIVPGNISKVDESYPAIKSLTENIQILSRKNQEMVIDIKNLMKIINQLLNQQQLNQKNGDSEKKILK